MLQLEVLILKFVAIDRLAPSAVTLCEVTALNHELLDDPVERGPLITITLLTSGKGSEVLRGLRRC